MIRITELRRMKARAFAMFILVGLVLASCKDTTRREAPEVASDPAYVKLTLPESKMVYTLGDRFVIHAAFDTSLQYQKAEYYIDNKKVAEKGPQQGDTVEIETKKLVVGVHSFSCKVIRDSQYVDIDNVSFVLLSDVSPQQGKYKIINVFPHDIGAYTQGLIYTRQGKLFEGTGMRGESKLKEVKLKTGETVRETSLSSEYFGEGITIVNNRIIQLTWQSNLGFVYELDSFKKLKEFSYPTEGWGLTFDGKYLVMSDGSENLTYLDTANFTIVKRQQVYDNNGPITKINELEYVSGYIYANIYTTDFIVKIDPQTGKIVKRWDLTTLLNESERTARTDVLNGIAYNEKTGRFYITGKYWPKLFDMKLY